MYVCMYVAGTHFQSWVFVSLLARHFTSPIGQPLGLEAAHAHCNIYVCMYVCMYVCVYRLL